MSHTSINIIYIFGSMEILKLVEKKIGTSNNSLIGSKVSKKWKNAHIENLIFEKYQDISDFSTKEGLQKSFLRIRHPMKSMAYELFIGEKLSFAEVS